MPMWEAWLHYLMYLALGMVRTRRAAAMSASAMPSELLALAPPGSDEHRRLYLRSLVTHMWPRLIWVLGQHDHRLIEVPTKLPLITADHPVGMWTDRPAGIRELGLLSARLLVHPIDRHRVLWFKKPMDPWPDWLDDPLSVSANANWAMAQVGTREVFAHPDDVGRILLWLPDGDGVNGLRAVLPIARKLPLWVPAQAPLPELRADVIEAALARSERSRRHALIARELGLDPASVLAAQVPPRGGPFAALLRADRGISTLTGEIILSRAA